jgi:thiol-disulfide isomerase/thioredoxin
MAELPPATTRSPVSPLLWCLVLVAIVVAFNRNAIVFGIELDQLLDGEAPAEAEVEALIRSSGREREVVEALWQSGRVALRRTATEFIAAKSRNQPLSDWAETILLRGAADPDYSLRDSALRNLSYRRHPQILGLLLAQLPDPDPEAQILAIDRLRFQKFTNALPAIADQLTNSQPLVVARAAATIRAFTGEDFGVTTDDLINAAGAPEKERAAGLVRFGAAAARAVEWWKSERENHVRPEVAVLASRLEVTASLELVDASMKPAGLEEFAGRPTLLCFITSWCPSCAMTINQLKELESDLGGVALLGVSLDAIPDEHNHFGEDEADGHSGHAHGHGHEHAHEPDLDAIVRKSEKVLRERGIEFPLTFDVAGLTTGDLDGGEIPAFVLLDADRRLVRRFSGFRNAAAIRAIVNHHYPLGSVLSADGE